MPVWSSGAIQLTSAITQNCHYSVYVPHRLKIKTLVAQELALYDSQPYYCTPVWSGTFVSLKLDSSLDHSATQKLPSWELVHLGLSWATDSYILPRALILARASSRPACKSSDNLYSSQACTLWFLLYLSFTFPSASQFAKCIGPTSQTRVPDDIAPSTVASDMRRAAYRFYSFL